MNQNMQKYLDKAEQGCEPDFVVSGGDAFPEVVERDILPAFFHYRSGDGDLDAQEKVSLSILPFPCFEKTGQTLDQRGVGCLHHSGLKNIHM